MEDEGGGMMEVSQFLEKVLESNAISCRDSYAGIA